MKVSAADEALLRAAAGGDEQCLHRWLIRRSFGEPLAYIIGSIIFRGHRFMVDRRVYITDPELTHLIDYVLQVIDKGPLNRPLRIVEFGIGCASLSCSLALERPGRVELCGVDLDDAALKVAAANAELHGLSIQLWASDGLDHLPHDYCPDMLFADPPWGDADSLYDAQRDQQHYQAMPPLAVSPLGNPVALHEMILRQVSERDWPCRVALNAGVLPDPLLKRLQRFGEGLGAKIELYHPVPELTLVLADYR